MKLLLIQSQEHPSLPVAELNAVIDCENIECKVHCICEGLVILDSIKKENLDDYYKILVRRLGYTHEVHEVISEFNFDNLEEEILKVNWSNYIKKNFAVRVKRFRSEIDTIKTERSVGSLILSSTENIKVNLDNPDSLIRFVIYENTVYLSIRRYELNKKHFEDFRPHKRPFFYPGSMSPKLARCMVNLSRVKEGELLLDPFCGTGGFLIEGGLVGAKLVGSDINWKMKNGTAINLDYCGITDYRTFNLDVRELEMYQQADAVVTDPPYGISTSTGDIKGDEIFNEFFKAIKDNMTDDAYLCMASPHYVDLNPMIENVGFKLIEQYHIKMHRSLTRVISVIKKDC